MRASRSFGVTRARAYVTCANRPRRARARRAPAARRRAGLPSDRLLRRNDRQVELKAKLSEALEQIEDTEMEVEQAEQERVREKHRADEANRRAEAARGRRDDMVKRRVAKATTAAICDMDAECDEKVAAIEHERDEARRERNEMSQELRDKQLLYVYWRRRARKEALKPSDPVVAQLRLELAEEREAHFATRIKLVAAEARSPTSASNGESPRRSPSGSSAGSAATTPPTTRDAAPPLPPPWIPHREDTAGRPHEAKLRLLYMKYHVLRVPSSSMNEVFASTADLIARAYIKAYGMELPNEQFCRNIRGELASLHAQIASVTLGNAKRVASMWTDVTPWDQKSFAAGIAQVDEKDGSRTTMVMTGAYQIADQSSKAEALALKENTFDALSKTCAKLHAKYAQRHGAAAATAKLPDGSTIGARQCAGGVTGSDGASAALAGQREFAKLVADDFKLFIGEEEYNKLTPEQAAEKTKVWCVWAHGAIKVSIIVHDIVWHIDFRRGIKRIF